MGVVIMRALILAVCFAVTRVIGQPPRNSRAEGDMSAISAGGHTTCGRVRANHCHGAQGRCSLKGAVECWGSNQYGQGNPPAGVFLKVSVGRDAACGITIDGAIRCWGNEDSMIVTNPPHAFGFTKLSVGGNHACALWRGKAACWGANEYGEATPPPGPFDDIACGYSHTCAIQSNGLVHCWGHDGEKAASGHPLQARFTSVTAGDSFSCGVTIQRQILCWGRNSEGQSSPPTDVFVKSIAAGRRHACAVRDAERSDNSAVCWGSNHEGQSRPRFKGLFVQVTTGAAHSCGLTKSGMVRCWGRSQRNFELLA